MKPDIERKLNMPSIAPIRKKTLSDSVKDSLRKLISEKAFNEAGKLPPEEELARQLAVSRITIRKALTDLEQEGLLLRIHGRGTFVNAQKQPLLFQVQMCIRDRWLLR